MARAGAALALVLKLCYFFCCVSCHRLSACFQCAHTAARMNGSAMPSAAPQPLSDAISNAAAWAPVREEEESFEAAMEKAASTSPFHLDNSSAQDKARAVQDLSAQARQSHRNLLSPSTSELLTFCPSFLREHIASLFHFCFHILLQPGGKLRARPLMRTGSGRDGQC